MGASAVLRAPRSWSGPLQATGVLLALSAFWFLVNAVRPVGPLVLLWLPTPLTMLALVVLFGRTSRVAPPAGPPGRFWRHLTSAAGLVGVAATAQAIDFLQHPDAGGPHVPPLMMA